MKTTISFVLIFVLLAIYMPVTVTSVEISGNIATVKGHMPDTSCVAVVSLTRVTPSQTIIGVRGNCPHPSNRGVARKPFTINVPIGNAVKVCANGICDVRD